MPKMKTKSAAKKRFRLTGKGKVKVGKKNHRHLMINKTNSQRHRSRGKRLLEGADAYNAKKLLPYG